MLTSDLSHRGVQPRVLLLDLLNDDGEPRAALIVHRELPLIFPTLSEAMAALRLEMRT